MRINHRVRAPSTIGNDQAEDIAAPQVSQVLTALLPKALVIQPRQIGSSDLMSA